MSLSEATTTAWETADTKEATLELAGDVVVEADDARFRELLENLFHNAVEHADHTATIEVGALEDREGFYVADDGPGIPDDLAGDVFEHGFTTADDGTGFGLAIVDSIAEAHGWSVTVTDGSAGGARFEFTQVAVHDNLAAQT
ncbi:hypothetical protein BRC82_09480 [Halobacteriales archaeon QS_1_67_19]|nr:MAG: hypothetical protein BRC82_09480 [Halobacteriales archaeon QS_1_67_19]